MTKDKLPWVFDNVFDERTSTEKIYRETCQPLLGAVFQGANAACFAYGQTGSGKTFTMMGPDNIKGQKALGMGNDRRNKVC